jgi:hypothetical protein
LRARGAWSTIVCKFRNKLTVVIICCPAGHLAMLFSRAVVPGCLIFIGLSNFAPGFCRELKPEDASHFVVGRAWSFICSEGTLGFGRLDSNGSVRITIKEPGQSPVPHSLPAGTVVMRADSNCAFAQVGPVVLKPCFTVSQTGPGSFRGRVSSPFWMWALWGRRYCDFVAQDGHS